MRVLPLIGAALICWSTSVDAAPPNGHYILTKDRQPAEILCDGKHLPSCGATALKQLHAYTKLDVVLGPGNVRVGKQEWIFDLADSIALTAHHPESTKSNKIQLAIFPPHKGDSRASLTAWSFDQNGKATCVDGSDFTGTYSP